MDLAAAFPHTISTPIMWVGFVAFVLLATAVDLNLGHRSLSTKSALLWSAVWISLALCFAGGLWLFFGHETFEEYIAGYLLEKSLSVDNLFVFVLVFAFFRTPPKLQHRALVWGIVGAMIMRAGMILSGAALIQRFAFVEALFGALLVYTGAKLLFHDDEADPSKSPMVRFLQRHLPLTDGYRRERFFVREAKSGAQVPGARAATDGSPAPGGPAVASAAGVALPDPGARRRVLFTRLFLVLVVIELSDVLFALDSVPAIFGVTRDPFIVFTSNIFAILGLRALYFAIARAIQRLQYLNYGLSLILSFIGVKMILPFVPGALRGVGVHTSVSGESLKISTSLSLVVICAVLVVTTVVSLLKAEDDEDEDEADAGAQGDRGEERRDAADAAEPEPVAHPSDRGDRPEGGGV